MKKILKYLMFGALAMGLLISLGLVNMRYDEKHCSGVRIFIENEYQNYFITDNDVMELLTNQGYDKLVGVPISQIDLREIERRVLEHKFIHRAEAFKDHSGQLNVRVYQSRPLARIINGKIADRYISDLGKILPVSSRYTARVLLIGGELGNRFNVENMLDDHYGKDLFTMIQFIEQEPFWKAQIAQLNIDKKGEITIYPQVGKQIIEFGRPEDIERKFARLRLFYDEILPAKGWNHYSKVNVKFQKQIICE
ncbi:MAG: cell division protein FtsQ [Cyclobacteriaceae bacterium]|nr:cell division protein FtsQ [Cyclobacteriaceae bacterium]